MKSIFLLIVLAAGSQAADYKLKAAPDTVVWGYYWAGAKPVLRIRSGDTVTIQTMITNSPERLTQSGLKPDEVQPELKAIYADVKDKGREATFLPDRSSSKAPSRGTRWR